MGITEIPKSYVYSCDACGSTHRQENAEGHYTNSCPPKWLRVSLITTKDTPKAALLCDSCANSFFSFWIKFIERESILG